VAPKVLIFCDLATRSSSSIDSLFVLSNQAANMSRSDREFLMVSGMCSD